MRALLWMPILVSAMAPVLAVSPAADELSIRVSANVIGAHRGEALNAFVGGTKGNGGLILQQPQRGTLSRMRASCGFAARPSNAEGLLDDGARGGWTTEVTPIRVVDRAVTFHVSWTRFGEDGVTPAAHGEQEPTLDPGESVPLDLVYLSARERQALLPACDMEATSLRVSVEYLTSPRWDRRLVETDVWLVEHLPGDKERSQHTQLRSEFNVPASFYFDDISTGDGILDIGGGVVFTQRDGFIDVEVQPWSRLTKPDNGTDMNTMAPLHVQLGLKSNDVGAIELPAMKGLTTPRKFSIRIQTKQIR